MSEELDRMRLNLVPGITPRAAAVLLDAFGGAGAALAAAAPEVASLRAVGRKLAARIADPPTAGDARAEVRRARREGLRLLFPDDDAFPALLREIPDPPLLLYARGEPAGDEAAVAIVGARRATVYGRVQAERFGAGIARAGPAVVSGLARGVDGAAHRGALDAGGRTVAVLGCGLDRVYPPEHRGLAREVARSGAILSELPLGRPPLARHFPMRNRIIAGMSLGTVVIEGRLRSGSLITARLANEGGRTVFALPGRVDTDLARGPHALVRDGAILATSPEEVVEDLGFAPPGDPTALPPPADPAAAAVLAALDPSEPRGVDEILLAVERSAPEVLAALTSLELDGRIAALPGRRYVRKP